MHDAAERVRYLIEREDYAGAGEVWREWTASLAAGGLSAEEWARVRGVFQWGRGVLMAERAQLMEQLNAVHAAGAYGMAAEKFR